jgi:hypothetical protein
MERGGRKRQGIVLAKDPSPKGKPAWTIQFDGERKPTEGVRSNKLKLIRDERQMTWTICEDATPPGLTVEAFQNNGVLEFDFSLFAKEELNVQDDSQYKFPFLQLLIRLWPGNWREQL